MRHTTYIDIPFPQPETNLVLHRWIFIGRPLPRVEQRTHEIGIRMAMGAGKPQVLRMVVGGGMKISAIGAAIGTVFALPLPKLFESMFSDFPVREPGLYVLVPLVLLAIGVFATYLPARRATQLDPMQALGQE